MKFYFVTWYDHLDDDFSPVIGENASGIACRESEIDECPMFISIEEATAYLTLAKENEYDENYYIFEINSETGEVNEVVGN